MNASDPESLSPADEARIRGLLAEARHSEPMPDDVVARMDSVIAGLAAEQAPVTAVVPAPQSDDEPDDRPDDEPASPERSAEVIAMPSPWRRRITTGMLAAAAVVAVGVGVPQLLSGDDYSIAGSTESADSDAGGAADTADPAEASTPIEGQAEPDAPAAKRQEFKSRADVTFVLATSGATAAEDAAALTDPRRDYAPSKLPCWRKRWGAGDRVPVLYDDRAGVAVLRLPGSSGTRVDFYVCDQAGKVRSVLVPD